MAESPPQPRTFSSYTLKLLLPLVILTLLGWRLLATPQPTIVQRMVPCPDLVAVPGATAKVQDAPPAQPTGASDVPAQAATAGRADWQEWGGESFPKASAETLAKDVYTHAHCVGVGERGGQTWKKASCRFRNLCYNTRKKEFVYYKAKGDPFGSRHAVAVGALNAQWQEPDKDVVRWLPTVVDGPIPKETPYRTTGNDTVVVIHAEHCAANVMHFIMDQLYAWHTLVETFAVRKHIVPLRVVLSKNLWGTCDYIREEAAKGMGWAHAYQQRCPQTISKWLPAFLPKVNGNAVQEIADTKSFMVREDTVVCFKDALVGAGVASDHCGKGHGWDWDARDHGDTDCNQNRQAALYSFRKRMIEVTGARHLKPAAHKVLLFNFGGRGGVRWSLLHNELVRRVPEAKVALATLGTPAAQIEEVQQATVLVAAMGGNTVTALFLPRHAGLVLVHDNTQVCSDRTRMRGIEGTCFTTK